MSLALAGGLDLDRALMAQDMRADYGEDRFIAMGPIDGAVFVLVFTYRGAKVRAISLRPANKKEIALWLT